MNIAIVGATGVVGQMMLKILAEREVDVTNLSLFASKSSAGKVIIFNGKNYIVEELTEASLTAKFDYILMSAGSKISKKFSPIASKSGNTIIDNSSAFRRDKNIPLIIPEVNSHILENYQGIIANPNCSTIQMVLALQDLHKKYKLKKIVVSTYQAVSGAGNSAIESLINSYKIDDPKNVFSHQINNNIIPQIGDFISDNYTEEEEKMRFETKKILEDSALKICATTVRVPVINGHSEMIYAEFENPIDLDEAIQTISQSEGVKYHTEIITPLDVQDSDYSHVCRLRYGVDKYSLTFWNVAHNLRVGAATNAVKIVEKLIRKNSKILLS